LPSTDTQDDDAAVRPPELQTGRDAGASRLELFFDLAFVLVVMELAGALTDHLTWGGLGTFVGLYLAIWFSWVGFTLYANRFDTDDVVFRAGKLTATLAIAGCAASASGATGSLGTAFAISYLLGRLVLLAMHVRAWMHVEDGRPTINVYLVCNLLSALCWAASIPVTGAARFWLWGVGVLAGAVAPVLVSFREHSLPLQIQHLPERFSLFVILVLGEALGGAVLGVHDAKWAGPSVQVGVVGAVLAVAMWWIYFDVTERRTSAELKDEDDSNEGVADERHDAFIYGHVPLTLGIVLVGVAIEDLAVHPADAFPRTGGWLLAAGLVLFLAGVVLVLGGTTRSWRSVLRWPAVAVLIVVAAAAVPHSSSLLLVGICGAVFLAVAALGTSRGGHQSAIA
jgi:low temperature requirement protein LtrA